VRVGAAARAIEIVGGRVTGVRLDGGERVPAANVVNAAGPWATGLMRGVEIQLPLVVVRPEQAFFEPPADARDRRTIYGDLVTGLYWKPEAAGWTRVGSLSYDEDPEVDPDHYDEGVSGAFIGRCRRGISERLPAYRNSPSWGGCGALYTVTPDAHPLIGAVPGHAGLWLVSGFSGHGFKMGPAVGRGVAALIAGGDSAPFDPAFFAVDRFERNAPVASRYPYGILG
jgi:glycine/D-amino acid oxidase-like deaminating enzyme